MNVCDTQDGRLRENDRLVRLNGVLLVGRSNSQTMRTLREALRCRGSVPGHVDVVVARQVASGPAMMHCCSSSEIVSEMPPRPGSITEAPTKTAKSVLRNVSYQMANGDSFVADGNGLSTPLDAAVASRPLVAEKAPTINGGRVDTVLIETDASQPSNVSFQSLLTFSIQTR